MDDHVDRLPRIEQEILKAIASGERQHAIGARLGWTQAGISYRYGRAQRRLRLLQLYPGVSITRQQVDQDLPELRAIDRAFLADVLRCTCVAEAGRIHQIDHRTAWYSITRLRRYLAAHYPESVHRAALEFLAKHPRFLADREYPHRKGARS